MSKIEFQRDIVTDRWSLKEIVKKKNSSTRLIGWERLELRVVNWHWPYNTQSVWQNHDEMWGK